MLFATIPLGLVESHSLFNPAQPEAALISEISFLNDQARLAYLTYLINGLVGPNQKAAKTSGDLSSGHSGIRTH